MMLSSTVLSRVGSYFVFVVVGCVVRIDPLRLCSVWRSGARQTADDIWRERNVVLVCTGMLL